MPTQHDNISFIFLIYNIYSKKNTHNEVTAISTIQKKCILPSFHTVAEIKKPTLSAIAFKVDHRWKRELWTHLTSVDELVVEDI